MYKLKINITFFNIAATCKSSTKRKYIETSRPFRNFINANKEKKGRINITRVKNECFIDLPIGAGKILQK